MNKLAYYGPCIIKEWKNFKRMYYRVGGNINKARLMENDS